MHYIVLGMLFVLFLIVVIREKKEKEKFFWLKILLFFLSFLLTLNISSIRLPLGIVIAFFIIIKFTKLNKSIKKLTLLFSLIGFIVLYYLIPPLEFNQAKYSSDIYNQLNRFKVVEEFSHFSNEAPIQEEMHAYSEGEQSPQLYMIVAYVLKDKEIPIKSKKWLKYDAHRELDFDWSSHTLSTESRQISDKISESYGTSWEVYFRFNQTGEEYLAYFKREDDVVYLKYVIKGKFKQGQEPRSIFF
ncbi:hypothetical protein GCM10008967_36930 [Bacillus carboniphilus]|uniref:Uncharacterized protein n=1 Tax=Bacillus carboniphilus TaxID=86663 RepID=A0ABP3GDY6_9BACI